MRAFGIDEITHEEHGQENRRFRRELQGDRDRIGVQMIDGKILTYLVRNRDIEIALP